MTDEDRRVNQRSMRCTSTEQSSACVPIAATDQTSPLGLDGLWRLLLRDIHTDIVEATPPLKWLQNGGQKTMAITKAFTALAAASIPALLILSPVYAESIPNQEKHQLDNSAQPDVDPGASKGPTSRSSNKKKNSSTIPPSRTCRLAPKRAESRSRRWKRKASSKPRTICDRAGRRASSEQPARLLPPRLASDAASIEYGDTFQSTAVATCSPKEGRWIIARLRPARCGGRIHDYFVFCASFIGSAGDSRRVAIS